MQYCELCGQQLKEATSRNIYFFNNENKPVDESEATWMKVVEYNEDGTVLRFSIVKGTEQIALIRPQIKIIPSANPGPFEMTQSGRENLNVAESKVKKMFDPANVKPNPKITTRIR